VDVVLLWASVGTKHSKAARAKRAMARRAICVSRPAAHEAGQWL
jgi:hypothetical protein